MTEPKKHFIRTNSKDTDQSVRRILSAMDLTTIDAVKHQIQGFILVFGFILGKGMQNELLDFFDTLPDEVVDSFVLSSLISGKFQDSIMDTPLE